MSELYSDTSRFARDLDAWILRDDRPECEDEPDSIVCDTRGCTATHPDCESAHEDGWLIEAGDADNDPVRLCPKCKSGQTAAEQEAQAARHAAFDAAWERLTQAHESVEGADWSFVSLLRARDGACALFEPPYWIARIESGESAWQSENANPGRAVTDVLGAAGVVESVCGEQRGEVGLS